jgi:hypothetical protein
MSSTEERAGKEESTSVDLESPVGRVNAAGEVHDKVPGRMRVRLKPELRTPEAMAKLHKSLAENPDVRHVRVNERTGSVTFTHGVKKDGYGIFDKALKETELLAEVAFDIPGGDAGDGGEDPYGRLDQQLADLVYKVEGVAYKKTGLRFRGQLVAGSVAGLGVAQMVIYGISLEMLPGPVLIWLGWDIYHRVNKEPPLPGEHVPDNGEAAEAGADAEAEAESGAGFTPADGLPAAA